MARLSNLRALTVAALACGFAGFGSGAMATEYYTTSVPGTPVLGTTIFENTSGPAQPDLTGSYSAGYNLACAGGWCYLASDGLLGNGYTNSNADTDTFNIGASTKFNDGGYIPNTTTGFMLGVSNPEGSALTTAPGLIAQPLPTDLHLVLTVSDAFAATAVGHSFSSLFPAYSENDVINAVIVNDGNYSGSVYAYDNAHYDYNQILYPALNILQDFSGTYGGEIGYSLPDTTYALLSFTNGVAVGAGIVTEVAPSAAPEPAGWTLMILGFGLLGLSVRANRQKGLSLLRA